MMHLDGDSFVKVLMGLSAALVTWAGVVLSRRGQKDTREMQEAANELEMRVQTVKELETIIDSLKQQRDYHADEAQRMRNLQTAEAHAIAERCQNQVDRLIDTIATLQTVVQDEIERSAAKMAVVEAREHVQIEHGLREEGA